MKMLQAVLVAASLVASVVAVPTHLGTFGIARGVLRHVHHSASHRHGLAAQLADMLDSPRMAEKAGAHSRAKGVLGAMTDFASYEASVMFDTAAVDKLGLTGASGSIQGYFNAIDDLGVTDDVVGGTEDAIATLMGKNEDPTPLHLDKVTHQKEQDKANAMHLACAIHLSYWKSDLKFFHNKLITGFGIFMKVIKNLVLIAYRIGKAIYKAVKANGKKGMVDKVKNLLSPLFGSQEPDKAEITKTKQSLSEKLREGAKKVGKVMKDSVKGMMTLRNLLRVIDLVYHVLIESVFPKELRDRIGMAATVISQLLPGKLTKAKSRCMACLLTAPPEAQLALVYSGKESKHICHMKVGSGSGPLAALYSDEEGAGVTSAELGNLASDLTSWMEAEVSKPDSKKDAAYMGVRLALSKTNSFLNGPATTLYDVIDTKSRQKAYGELEVSNERREMAAGYYGSASWKTHTEFLRLFIGETKSSAVIKYERETDPQNYAVPLVADKKAMVAYLEHLLKLSQAELMKDAIGKRLLGEVVELSSKEMKELEKQEEQYDENKAQPPTTEGVTQAIKS